jgi:hypothetical protein
MLRRLAFGFAGLITAAIAIAACSSKDATQTISVGPSFAPQTIYAANVSQNAINIYPSPGTTSGPRYEIGGTSTTLAGPQYMAFDSHSNLWVTNWLSSTGTGLLVEFEASATGNVTPYQAYSLGTARPRGIANARLIPYGSTTTSNVLAVAVVDPTQLPGYTSGLQLYSGAALTAPYAYIAGPSTGLDVPSGEAVDSKQNLYVSNLQGASVDVFALAPLASASPSPTSSASPTASPTSSPTPVGATPSPVPTSTPLDLAPIATVAGTATTLGQPTGLALDASDNIYVSDQASTICGKPCPAILVFAAGSTGSVAPTRSIAGSNTLLAAPTDVKVDSSGNLWVADSAAGAGVIYEFASGASGNVAPTATLKSPGALIGLALAP